MSTRALECVEDGTGESVERGPSVCSVGRYCAGREMKWRGETGEGVCGST